MNYLLSVYCNRVTGANNVQLYCGGVVEKSYSGKFEGSNIKENILSCLHRGLRLAMSMVKHDDFLYIEIQNQHLVDWLMGRKEYNGYDELLDDVFETTDQLDCRYKYLFDAAPKAKRGTLTPVKKVVETSSIEEMMKEFEG